MDKWVFDSFSILKEERIMFITHLKPLQSKTAITDDLFERKDMAWLLCLFARFIHMFFLLDADVMAVFVCCVCLQHSFICAYVSLSKLLWTRLFSTKVLFLYFKHIQTILNAYSRIAFVCNIHSFIGVSILSNSRLVVI